MEAQLGGRTPALAPPLLLGGPYFPRLPEDSPRLSWCQRPLQGYFSSLPSFCGHYMCYLPQEAPYPQSLTDGRRQDLGGLAPAGVGGTPDRVFVTSLCTGATVYSDCPAPRETPMVSAGAPTPQDLTHSPPESSGHRTSPGRLKSISDTGRRAGSLWALCESPSLAAVPSPQPEEWAQGRAATISVAWGAWTLRASRGGEGGHTRDWDTC